MSKLKGKFVLITGASSGIGKSLSFQVAAHQAIPILIARSEEKLVSISKKIEQEYQIKALYYAVDITDQERWGAILQEIQLAVHPIDVLINNAGIGYFESFEKMEWDYVNSMLRLNLESLYFTTYKLLPNMKLHSPAHIVNIGSQAGKIATPKSAVYSATKAGVINFSNALRMELEPEVFVTSVNIGPVRTAFFDQADPSGSYQKSISKYMLDPDDVAKSIVKYLFTKKREINLPYWMHIGSRFYQNFPRIMEQLLKPAFKRK